MSWLQQVKTEYHRLNSINRAISHRPDLAGRVHLLSSRQDVAEPELSNFSDYAQVYASHVWVRRALTVIRDHFSVLPLQVYDKDEEALPNHPLASLFAMGNDANSAADVWAAWVDHQILGGEAFFEIVSDSRQRPAQFWPRRPDWIGVLPDATRPLYPVPGGYIWERENIEYAADEMIQWKFNHPTNPWRGLSLIQAARESIVIDIFSKVQQKYNLKAGGNPDLIIYGPQGMARSERESLQLDFVEQFRGWENWSSPKPIVVENEVFKIEPLSWPPADMQWLEQENKRQDEIAALLGVPDILMGYGTDTYDTEEKRKNALRTLYVLTIIPLAQFRDRKLNQFFTYVRPLLKPGEVIATDYSEIQWLRTDAAEMAEVAKLYFSMGVPFSLINEIFDLGFPTFPGDRTGYLPINLIPAGSAPPEQPQAPPAPPAQGQEEEAPKAVRKAPAFDSIEHRAMMMRSDVAVRPYEAQLKRLLLKYFQRQQNDVSQALRDKTPQQKQFPPVAELLDQEEEIQHFVEEISPVVLALAMESGQDALELVLGAEAAPALNMTSVHQAIDYILEHHAVAVNDTTFTEMTSLFQEAAAAGESIPQVMERLSEFWQGRKSAYQLERIARTTLIPAYNAAALEGYAQSGVVYGSEWLAAIDNRVRDTHAAAHGQFRPIGGRFEVGAGLLRYPGDPSGPSGEVVNCRCTLAPVTRQP